MRKKDALIYADTIKVIVFRNGFVTLNRDTDGSMTGIPMQTYKKKLCIRPRRRRPHAQMRKFSFRAPLPPLPF